jgi:chromosome segregation ATPase
MDLTAITNVISTVGFPIACVIVLGFFVYQVWQRETTNFENQIQTMQEKCSIREEKLYKEIAENRAVNQKAIETIASYAEKLTSIQDDVKDIKTDIIEIKARQ